MVRIRALRINRDIKLGEKIVADIDGEGCALIAAATYYNESK